jgi:hypothetical protein
MRHEGTDQHIADPHLVGPRGFETTIRPRLTGQRGTLQAAALEMLTDRALGHTNAVTGEKNGANLDR